jgi:hypothetical protein
MEPSVWDLLHNGRSIGEFWLDWRNSTNPWRAAWTDGDNTIEIRIFVLTIMFLVIHVTMLRLKKMKLLSDVLASRPTLVANQLHCTSVSLMALFLLCSADESKPEPYAMWAHWGIPISMAYFCADILW